MTKKGAIILIEDDPSVLSAVRRILARDGYEVAGFLRSARGPGGTSRITGRLSISSSSTSISRTSTGLTRRDACGTSRPSPIFPSSSYRPSIPTRTACCRGLSSGPSTISSSPLSPDIFLKKVENFVRLKQSTERIELLSRRYRLLFEEYSDPTFILDRAGKILEANTSARTILGARATADCWRSEYWTWSGNRSPRVGSPSF